MSQDAWMPAWIGSRRDEAEDLVSGRAWARLLESLDRAGALLRSDSAPQAMADQASGYKHLLVLLALGIDEALRHSDRGEPHIEPANVDNVLKWGMDCPDAAYSGCGIRGDATYRVHGSRGTVRYLGLQVMGGIESTANVVADDLDIDEDGTFSIVLSATEHQGNWMPLSSGASSLVVRQFFYDWQAEEPARLTIELVDKGQRAPLADRSDGDRSGAVTQLEALGQFVEANLGFFVDIEEAGRAQGLNTFRDPVNRTDMGAAAESVTVWGSWQLDDDEALIIEVTPPEALYWSIALGNYWWETIDYANHQSSLNGHQAFMDDDGVFRAVVAHRDPGVANWLDSAGQSRGTMIFRWVRASGAPVPTTRLVSFGKVANTLPTQLVDAEQRLRTIERRRAGVRKRFPR